MRMPDFRHPALQFAALPFEVEVEGRADPDALRQRRMSVRVFVRKGPANSPSPSRNRGTILGARLSGTNSETAAVAMTARVTSRLAIIARNSPICSALNDMPSGVTGSSANTLSKALRLHQHHAGRDDASGGMGRQVTERNFQRIERGQHVLRMLLHRIVGIVGSRRRAIALAATPPVDPDHPEAARKQRCGEFDPVLAGEIAVDEDDGDVALSPFSPAELNLTRTHPTASSHLLVQAGGRRRARRRRRNRAAARWPAPLTMPIGRERRVDDNACPSSRTRRRRPGTRPDCRCG